MDAGPQASRTAGGARCRHAGGERLAGGCPLCPRLLGPCQQGHSGHRVRAGPSQWGWRWWRGCCALRAAGSLGAAGTPALCPALAQISPRQSSLGSVCSHCGCCLSLCCLLCPQLAALLWFCSASLPVCPCACVCMYVPVCPKCMRVHQLPRASCTPAHPCAPCALCACRAPVHPCASMCISVLSVHALPLCIHVHHMPVAVSAGCIGSASSLAWRGARRWGRLSAAAAG